MCVSFHNMRQPRTSIRFLEDEVNDAIWASYSKRIMAFAFVDDNGNLTTEFVVALFRHARIAGKPGVETTANMEERHAGFGERGEIVKRLCFRHVAMHDGIFGADAGNLVRVFNGPGVGFSRCGPDAFHHGFPGKATIGEVFINLVPVRDQRAVGIVGDRAGDDMKPFGQQREINCGIRAYIIRPEYPGISGSRRLRHNDVDRSLDTLQVKSVSVVTLHKPRPTTRDVRPLLWEVAVEIRRAVEAGSSKF